MVLDFLDAEALPLAQVALRLEMIVNRSLGWFHIGFGGKRVVDYGLAEPTVLEGKLIGLEEPENLGRVVAPVQEDTFLGFVDFDVLKLVY